MKVQIIFSCTLAVAFAGWEHMPIKYHGPQHFPVIHKGVPIDTPEVQHARAIHLAAVADAKSQAGYEHENQHYNHEQEYIGEYSGHGNNLGYEIEHETYEHHDYPVHYSGYESTHKVPIVGHDGKLLDTPEVEAAKAKHFAAVQEVLARSSHDSHYRKRRSAESYVHFSSPMDTSSYDQGEYDYSDHQLPIHAYEIPHGYTHQEAPVDTYEVQKARAEHLLAHATATHSNTHGYSTHQVHAPVYGQHHSYSHETPAIGHDGKPLDTAEVEYAKALHFAAHHEAKLRNSFGHHSYHHEGPVDTPEVQHAKLAHFAAHAAAKAHHY